MAEMVVWCSGCSAEQATQTIEIEINEKWVSLNVGPACLTKLVEQGRLEM